MPYKKYIKRGGKVYGPYIYHSKRVDGKVVSEYHGAHKKKIDYKKFLWIGLGVLIVMLLIFGIYSLGKSISGKATYDLEIDYKEGEAIDGILRFSLKEGELLPSSSKLLFENNGNSYEYVLSDIISEELIEGNFYLEGKDISGSGKGYGIEGVKETYPSVYFTLEVYSEEETSSEENEEAEETPLQSLDEEIEEAVDTPLQNPDEEEVEELEEEIPEEEPVEEVGITGQAISFMFGWMATGNIVMELETEINGEVSAENPFTYNLEENEEVELKSKSVRTDIEELKDNTLDLNIEENKLTVTTDYSEKEKGFGEEYLGEDTISIEIDLSNLDLILDAGNLKVSLIYSNEEIISLETTLQEGTVKEKKEKKEETEEAEDTPLQNPEEEIPEEIPEEVLDIGIELTEEEKAILLEEFGSINIKTIREEIDGGRLIIGHQLREYKIEHSYEYPQPTEVLREQIDSDITKWLRDIVATLSKKESIPQKIDIIDDNYIL